MKILLLLLVLVCATPTLAADISGNVTLASTYDFRGMTQTNQEPAIQGGFDVVTDSGFYIGTWASNIAFDGSVEIDLYAGMSKTIGHTTIAVGVIHYAYPGQPAGQADSNFNEVYVSASKWDLTIGAAFSPEFFGETGKSKYYWTDYTAGDSGFSMHAGRTVGALEYTDWEIIYSQSFPSFDAFVSYGETSGDVEEDGVTVGISKSL